MTISVKHRLSMNNGQEFAESRRLAPRDDSRAAGATNCARVGFILMSVPTFAYCQGGAAEVFPNLLLDLARLGSAGLAALFIYLAYRLLKDNKKATLFLIVSVIFCIATLSVELVRYISPNQVGLAVFPGHFPTSIPQPLVMENRAPKTLTSGQGVVMCQPNAFISVDISDLVNALQQSEALVLRATAPNTNHATSEFGPDVTAGGRP